MKFRKKPIVIEAYQFFYPEDDSFPNAVSGDCYRENRQWYINTLEGRHEVLNGDWIITGVKGEKYPCKPDIFEMTYEKYDP